MRPDYGAEGEIFESKTGKSFGMGRNLRNKADGFRNGGNHEKTGDDYF